jgi:flagellar basal-body rod protein FlgF
MDRMLYVSMSGAKEAMLSQANNSNNLANANTDGFKKDFNQFRAQHMDGPGWHTRTYSLDERPATDFTPGPVKVTGRDLDVMTKADGFMAIQAPDGTEALTRSAAMQITPAGDLVDVNGNPILNEGGAPINIPPHKSLNIGDDGAISFIPADAPNNLPVLLDQVRLVQPDTQQLQKGEDGYVRFMGEDGLEQAPVRVVSGALEGSNVNTVEALTNMIELSRKYEMQVKMMSTAKTHSERSDSIVKLS